MDEHYPGDGAPEEVYRGRRDAHARELARLEGRSAWLGRGRLAAFLIALAAVVVAVAGAPTPRPVWLAVAGIAAVLFAVLVGADSRLGRRLRREVALARVYERALARKARDWKALDALEVPRGEPAGEWGGDGGEVERGAPAFVGDLHLFGHASLFRLLGTPGTSSGRRALARWLVEPPEVAGRTAEVRARQEAVRALAAELDWRAGLEALAWGPESDEPHLDHFYAWLAEEPWLLRRPLVLWSARLLTVATPAALLAWLLGPLPWSLALLVAFVSYLLSVAFSGRLHRDFERATAGADGLRGHGRVFRRLEDLPGEGRRLDELRERLTTAPCAAVPSEGRSAASWMDRLERLMVLADVRFGLMHFFVQVLLQWDFHLQARFERWRERAGPSARGWLEALGEVEALAALAALAHGQPEWAFPELDPEADAVAARDLGHPLIPDHRRVGNDVTVGPPGTFLLVTGSNMSGKTTLLRSVGANAVLAWAGGPVCAAGLRLPPVILATSIAVEDSLEEGVSFFLAELLRLKAVEAAAEASPPGARVVYLLDEILRGTNSLERRIAVQRVIGRLVSLGAIGAVTTHDLEILAEGELAHEARPIHFRETVRPRSEGGAEMTFDYLARPGVATTTNALRLLEAVGLGDHPARGDS